MEDEALSIRLLAAACSDKGCRRHNNEDNFCLNGRVMALEEMDEGGLFPCDAAPNALFAVCDGMGGEAAGEVASTLSGQLCAEYLRRGGQVADAQRLRDLMQEGCMKIGEQAERQGGSSGSTVAVLAADKKGITAANMGDSRIYRLHQGTLEQISKDHTEMQRLLALGQIRPEDVKTHPQRHVIRQYWGMPMDIAPFAPHITDRIPYEDGNCYLICSDGLTDMLEDDEIAEILARDIPVDAMCRALVEEALQKGGRDNVTTVVVRVEADHSRSRKGSGILSALHGLRERLGMRDD